MSYDDLNRLLEEVVRVVNESLREQFDKHVLEATSESRALGEIPLTAKEFTLRGGKRLRALLVLIGYWSREWGLEASRVRRLMSTVEFLQSYLLVHDDVMDRDETRRGGPTVHALFSRKCIDEGLVGDCVHYGISQAIIVGDYLESLAVNSLAELDLPSSAIAELIRTYTRALRVVSYGQYLDVLFSYKPLREVSEEDVMLVYKLKTASYSVEAPLHMGAIASGKHSEELLRDLSKYAIPAGVVFQLRDDILGLYGDESKTGKPVGSDVRERKKTVLIVRAYEGASESDRKFLEELFDRRRGEEVSLEDVARVQEIVKNTGSLEYVRELMESKAREAISALTSSRVINERAKRALGKLVELFMERER